jgi:hypothetical protein
MYRMRFGTIPLLNFGSGAIGGTCVTPGGQIQALPAIVMQRHDI